MMLCIDIGNSNIVLGIFDNDKLSSSFRMTTRHSLTSDEAGLIITGLLRRSKIEPENIKEVVLASVVPPLTPKFETTIRDYFDIDVLTISTRTKLPIVIDIDQPDQLGADRIANAVAAFKIYGGPITVIDFGTATNIDIINAEGIYIGGLLMPGPVTSMTELAKRAAKLFEVRLEQPDHVVGRSTAEALKSGLFYGTIGQIDYLVDKVIEETGFGNMKVIATGGLAGDIASHSRHISEVTPNLTLEGLRLIKLYCQ